MKNNFLDTIAQYKISREYGKTLFEFDFQITILILRTMLIMNSGALVSIMLSIAQSRDNGIMAALAEASSIFGYGLTAAFLGMLTCTPFTDNIKELENYFNRKIIILLIYMISIAVSAACFLFGIWEIIGGVKAHLTSL